MIQKRCLATGVNSECHLFEPLPACFEILRHKFQVSDVVLNCFAASDREGTATIYFDEKTSSLASLYRRDLDLFDIHLNQSQKIKLRRMDKYIVEHNIIHIDLVKIDVEGHELKVLQGFGDYLNGRFIDFIQFEYGGSNLDSNTSLRQMYKLLLTRGFILAKMMPKGLEVRDYAPFMEHFCYSNYVAVSERVIGVC